MRWESSSAAAECGSLPTLDCKLLGPCTLQTKSSKVAKDWWRCIASLMHLPNSSDRTSGCSVEVVLEELSTGLKPLAATVLGSVVGSVVGGVLGKGLDNGM